MPNVMGREFPYTPQGVAAAQQYRQTLGMRDGGMMGFRPVGMQAGGVPGRAGEDAVSWLQTGSPIKNVNAGMGAGAGVTGSFPGVNPLMMAGAGGRLAGGVPGADVPPDVMAIFQGLVNVTQSGSTRDVRAYIEANRQDLNDIASMLPQGQADFVQNILNSFAQPSEQGSNLGRIQGGQLAPPIPSQAMPGGFQGGQPAPPIPSQAMPGGFQGMAGGGLMSLRRR